MSLKFFSLADAVISRTDVPADHDMAIHPRDFRTVHRTCPSFESGEGAPGSLAWRMT